MFWKMAGLLSYKLLFCICNIFPIVCGFDINFHKKLYNAYRNDFSKADYFTPIVKSREDPYCK